MNEYIVSVCVRVRGVECYRLYIVFAANRNEALTKALARARKESLLVVPNKSWVKK